MSSRSRWQSSRFQILFVSAIDHNILSIITIRDPGFQKLLIVSVSLGFQAQTFHLPEGHFLSSRCAAKALRLFWRIWLEDYCLLSLHENPKSPLCPEHASNVASDWCYNSKFQYRKSWFHPKMSHLSTLPSHRTIWLQNFWFWLLASKIWYSEKHKMC